MESTTPSKDIFSEAAGLGPSFRTGTHLRTLEDCPHELFSSGFSAQRVIIVIRSGRGCLWREQFHTLRQDVPSRLCNTAHADRVARLRMGVRRSVWAEITTGIFETSHKSPF
jgi:hypothetical protein